SGTKRAWVYEPRCSHPSPRPSPREGAGLYPHLPLLDTAGLAGLARKIQNPESEIRNPKQIPMSKGANPQNQAAAGGLIGRVLRICHLNLVLVSDFEFRISDLSLHGGVHPKTCGTCSGEVDRVDG